jgi:hypothetical protein
LHTFRNYWGPSSAYQSWAPDYLQSVGCYQKQALVSQTAFWPSRSWLENLWPTYRDPHCCHGSHATTLTRAASWARHWRSRFKKDMLPTSMEWLVREENSQSMCWELSMARGVDHWAFFSLPLLYFWFLVGWFLFVCF